MPSAIRSVLVVGAGIAGLACALELTRAGMSVTLLDKGRRPGGRVATRRIGERQFNHGAQFATARGADFGSMLSRLQAVGTATAWPAAGRDAARMVFVPGMSALPAALADLAIGGGARLIVGRQACYLHAGEPGWIVRHCAAGDIRPGGVAATGGEVAAIHDAVVIAVPSPQAGALLATAAHPWMGQLGRTTYAPSLTVLAGFDAPVAGHDVLGDQAGAIGWAARENSRPGAATSPESWTLQATAAWSREHLEEPDALVAERMVARFQALTGAPPPVLTLTHRWRHALVEEAWGEPCLWDPRAGLGLCGDWCLGGRVEAAYDSGLALARRLLADRG